MNQCHNVGKVTVVLHVYMQVYTSSLAHFGYCECGSVHSVHSCLRFVKVAKEEEKRKTIPALVFELGITVFDRWTNTTYC